MATQIRSTSEHRIINVNVWFVGVVCMKRENDKGDVNCCTNKTTKNVNKTHKDSKPHTYTHTKNHSIARSYDHTILLIRKVGWSVDRSFKCALISQLIIKCVDHCSFIVSHFCDSEMGWERDHVIAGWTMTIFFRLL